MKDPRRRVPFRDWRYTGTLRNCQAHQATKEPSHERFRIRSVTPFPASRHAMPSRRSRYSRFTPPTRHARAGTPAFCSTSDARSRAPTPRSSAASSPRTSAARSTWFSDASPHRRRLRPCGDRGPRGVRESRRDDCLHARRPRSSRSPGRAQAARPLVPICAAFPQFSQKKAARHALSLSWKPTHTRIAARERTTSI